MDVRVPYNKLAFIVRGEFYPSKPPITSGRTENWADGEPAYWVGDPTVYLSCGQAALIDVSEESMGWRLPHLYREPWLYDYLCDEALRIADERHRIPEAA